MRDSKIIHGLKTNISTGLRKCSHAKNIFTGSKGGYAATLLPDPSGRRFSLTPRSALNAWKFHLTFSGTCT